MGFQDLPVSQHDNVGVDGDVVSLAAAQPDHWADHVRM